MQQNTPMSDDQLKQFRWALRILGREIGNQLKGGTLCCGVTPAQCHTLLEIDHRCCVSVSELADSFGLDRSTMSRNIDGLVNAGIVHRVPNTSDRRVLDIALTEQGKTLVHTIHSVCNESYRNLFRYIPEEKLKDIIDALNLFADAFRRFRREGGVGGCCK